MVGIIDLCKGLTSAKSSGGNTTHGQLPKSSPLAYLWNKLLCRSNQKQNYLCIPEKGTITRKVNVT